MTMETIIGISILGGGAVLGAIHMAADDFLCGKKLMGWFDIGVAVIFLYVAISLLRG